jgi:urease accessory protein
MRSLRRSGPLTLLLPAVAEAHAGSGDGALMTGLMHPVFGLDHLVAMISVGVVSAQLGGASIWRVPAAFVGAMAAAGALGVLQVGVPHAELGITASVLVLGMSIVLAHRDMAPWPIIALVLFFGSLHGYVHGIEIPRAVSPALYTLGFLISTSTLHIVGVLIGEVATMQTGLGRGLRIAGGVVTASGAAFLLHALGVMVPGVR